MAKEPDVHYNKLRSAVRGLIASHDTVISVIGEHATRHHTALEMARKERARQIAITEGAGKYAKGVQTGGTVG